jgi:hypothetical protein
MAFRYLIYRTDYGNTIIRESAIDDSGVNEAALFTDFVIPVNQPLYLWKEDTGDVVPNDETNINDWLAFTNPPSPDEPVNYDVFTGYTATTQTEIDGIVDDINFLSGATDGKLDKVVAVTGNVPVFGASGSTLVDSGYDINDLLGGISGGTPIAVFTAYTATTNIRLEGIEDDIVYLSGQTDNKLDITDFNSYTGATDTRLEGIEDDIVYLSGVTDTKLDKVDFTGYTATTDTRLDGIEADILYLSGITSGLTGTYVEVDIFTGYTASTETRLQGIEDDINYISGVTDTKLDESVFNAYTGVTDTRLQGIENDVDYISGVTDTKLDITDFNTYSAATKTYIDSIAAGLDPKASARVATTAPLTGATYNATGGTGGEGSFSGAPTVIDGITLANGDRILVKNQTNATQNGIYVVVSSGNWERSSDMDGSPNAEVSGGAFVFVETGNTLAASGWVIDWDGIVELNVDPINWVQFSAANSYIAGVGITINGNTISLNGAAIAGNNLDWDGSQLNVQITGGTLGSALDAKLDESVFNSYTGTTETRLTGIENDIDYISGVTDTKLDITDFNSYTGATDTRLDGIEDDIQYISGVTSGITTSKLDVSVFTGYTASTETRLDGIEDDIVYLSGITDTKLDTDIFTGYTASTKSDEICLIRTGTTGIDINTITPTAIVWNGQLKTSTVFSWTGGSKIIVNQTGEYEVTYNIPIVHTGNNNVRSYGSNLVLNNATVIDRTFAAENTSRADSVGNLALPSVVISLTSGDDIDLVAFRAGLAGVTNTRPDATILIKKKNTLQ